MKNLFSIGELARYQNLSKQTLIYYDKIGLFRPEYINPENGYRFYSAKQIDYLDTILILKQFGLSLDEIREHMKGYSAEDSYQLFRSQLDVIEEKIRELNLIKSRLQHKCRMMRKVKEARQQIGPQVNEERMEEQLLLCQAVQPPYTLTNIGIATKQCFARAYDNNLPVFFQSGVIVPLAHIRDRRYTEATNAFLPIEKAGNEQNIRRVPAGNCVSAYHFGQYETIDGAYLRLLDYCREHALEIISDSYEFCINDYITSGDESEYVTKIVFYVR